MDARSSERKARDTARETADRVQESASLTAEGFREYQLRIFSAMQANMNAFFEYAQDAVKARSVPELIEISTSHSRRQLEMMVDQAREMASVAQKLTGSARPLTNTFGQ